MRWSAPTAGIAVALCRSPHFEVPSHGSERELGAVASPEQQANRSVPCAVVRRSVCGHPSPEYRDRRFELIRRIADAERPLDQLVVHPDLLEACPDPLWAPPVECPPVLGESPGVPRVIDVAVLPQLVEGPLDRRLPDAVAAQPAPELGLRLVATTQLAKADRQRLVQSRCLAQAARSWPLRPFNGRPAGPDPAGGGGAASACGSIVVIRSFDRPSAA